MAAPISEFRWERSRIRTLCPARDKEVAAVRPAMPQPEMMMLRACWLVIFDSRVER